MKNSHLFVFAPGVFNSSSVEEIEATKRGLKEVGLYQMPYDRDVFIQINALECVGPEADPNHSVIYGPFGIGQTMMMGLHDARLKVTIPPDTVWDFPNEIATLEGLLIVLLATRNAVKVVKENKLARLGIGKKRSPFGYTTTISLPRVMDNDPDNPGTGLAKSPHLRRGHVRRQHHGQGNALEKKIWIAPVFVNADPDFVATRKKYRISARVASAA